MAEPASDDHVSSTENAVEYGMTISAEEVAPILARLRKAERERNEANRQLAAARESLEAVKDFVGSDFALSCVVLSAIADIDEHTRAHTQGGGNG